MKIHVSLTDNTSGTVFAGKAGGERKRLVSMTQSYSTCAEMKARQTDKIRELRMTLSSAGFATLDSQAKVLGLPRSTTWAILKGDHKHSGLSAAIINRMLSAPQLPLLVRAKIVEYVDEKLAGSYGHSKALRQKFAEKLSADCYRQPQARKIAADRDVI